MVELSQRQLLKQQQTLSPQQIQMIKLLELPALQLEQRIKQEIEENPVLEEEEEVKENEDGDDTPKEISVDEYLKEDDTPSYKTKANNYSKDDKQLAPTISGGRSLHEYLIEQLGYKNLDDREMTLARFLVGSIDDDGYLRRDLRAVADDIAFMLGIDTTREELEQILYIIHELEPAGIGARDLQECLVLQLESLSTESRHRQLAMKILTHYFDEFTKKHFGKLMARLGIDQEEFRIVMEEIMHLSPKPGNLYNEGGTETVPYVTPDFVLDIQGGEFTLRLNSWNVPEVKISKRYLEMLRGMSGREASQGEKDTVQFVKNKIESAKWFISAIQQRHDTLMRTMTEILDHQRKFFETGDKSDLRPMILKDIAERTGLDVSTISRVVNSKYVQTPFGIILLKELFSEAMTTEDGSEVTSHEIKQILVDCIAGEDKRHPIKDETLMEILNTKGYRIARRTVAKYREMLGIPVARLRKEL
ncbi:MAG: RNA polymerase factor sigma-54 [Alistipes sp.]|jgi:RNA polymerase sigma-54 factor|nr:RNA polymerase factor sigma-54 [Alistipes sp.]